MLIGLMSDSHGEEQNLKDAAWKLVHNWHVTLLVHLGDEWDDADAITDMRVEVLRIPGVYSSQYKLQSVPNRVIREIDGKRVLFTHTAQAHANDLPDDQDPTELAAHGRVDVVAYGHTHIPEARIENGVLWVNPGHLKNEDKKGHPPSFGVLEIDRDTTRALLIDLRSGDIFESCSSES